MGKRKLGEIGLVRSGDKGNHANVGVVSFTQSGFEFLVRELTAARVASFVSEYHPTRVIRYELPRVWGLNFVLYDVLAGGASGSLRTDTQGKLLGTLLTELELPDAIRL